MSGGMGIIIVIAVMVSAVTGAMNYTAVIENKGYTRKTAILSIIGAVGFIGSIVYEYFVLPGDMLEYTENIIFCRNTKK